MHSRPDWIDHLQTQYEIKVVRDGDLASLKYNQIESPMHEPLVQECRGMVVDTARERVLAWPYNKFWNLGEALAAPIDWATAVVQEKLDGSLMILYFDDKQRGWCVASSGTPRASGSFGSDSSRTFEDAFWEIWDAIDMREPGLYWRGTCFMFELCAANNRIVVMHPEPRLVLHGARDVETGVEIPHRSLTAIADACNWEVVKTFPLATPADCLAAAEALDPLNTEGFVVVDAQFNRVKIKSPRYVVLHHMKGASTTRRAIELWQTGETAELLAHFPEMSATITPVHDALDSAAVSAVADYEFHRVLPTRKDFALAVKDRPWSAVTFKLYSISSPADVAESKKIMRSLSLAALERIVEA